MVVSKLDKISVQAHDRKYFIKFVSDLSDLLEELSLLEENSYFLIDRKFNNLHKISQNFPIENIIFVNSSEKIKNLSFVNEIIYKLKKKNINKNSTIIAIGGGTLQDVSQFVASIFYRGIHFVFVPTTLQAITDSCMGGKTSINLDFFKNQLGTFYSPTKVLIYTNFISTLPIKELRGGYAELIKLLIIGRFRNFDLLYESIEKNIYDLENIAGFIKKALSVKKKYVEIDEFDVSERKILNYGHTFAHAIETILKNKITHGNATALGINLANFYSYKNELTSLKFFEYHFQFFNSFYQFNKISSFKELNGKNIVSQFIHDKKMKINGNIDLIIPINNQINILEVSLDTNLESSINEFFELIQD